MSEIPSSEFNTNLTSTIEPNVTVFSLEERGASEELHEDQHYLTAHTAEDRLAVTIKLLSPILVREIQRRS